MAPEGITEEPIARDERDRKLLGDIREYGWHVVAVASDAEGPGLAYSVGLHRTFNHPETLVLGLGTDVMFGMINGIGESVRGGKRFDHLDESEDALEGFNVSFRTVESHHFKEYVGCALWFYQGENFPLLQCVWPDTRHRYPWHPAFPLALKLRQPVLGNARSWPVHEGKNRMCFTTERVREGSPVLLVSHDKDGDWQFLCGTTNDPREGALVRLGNMLANDNTLAEIADLPEGWTARRTGLGAKWHRAEEVGEGDDSD